MSHRPIVLVGMLAGLLLAGYPPRVEAQGRGSDEVQKEIENLSKKITGIVAQKDERIAALEKQLQEKDKEIAALKKKVEEMSAAKKPAEAPKPEPAKTEKPKGAPILGVEAGPVGEEDRSKLNLEEGRGAKVFGIAPNSPAASAGIQPGDVIISIGGKEVSGVKIRDVVQGFAPGDKVEIVYLRGTEKVSKTATLADREKFLGQAPPEKPTEPARQEPSKPVEPAKPPASQGPVVLGLLVEETASGLLVQNVEPGKTGAVAGIKEGDIIAAVNGKSVKTLDEISTALVAAKVGQEMTIAYKRKDADIRAKVIAAGEQGEPKVVGIEGPKPEEKPAQPKPAEQKKPATLGVDVVEEDGVKILAVKPGGAGAAAGLREGDVILELGGKQVRNLDDVKAAMQGLSAGDTTKIVIRRGGEQKTIENVKLGAAGETVPAKPEEPKPEQPKKKGVLGITANETEGNRGVSVAGVTSGAAGDKAGIRVGDVITKMNGVDIKNFDDVERALQGVYAGDRIKVTVQRGGETKELEVELGRAAGAPMEESRALFDAPIHLCARALGARTLVGIP